MAALGKIRRRGITLIVIIGLGLFAFIAEEAFRSCNGIKGEARQQVGEISGEKRQCTRLPKKWLMNIRML